MTSADVKVELLGRREGVWLAVPVLRAWLGGVLGWMLHCICTASVGKSPVRGDVEWPVCRGVQKGTKGKEVGSRSWCEASASLDVPGSCYSTAIQWEDSRCMKLAMMLLIDMPFNHAELKMLEKLYRFTTFPGLLVQNRWHSSPHCLLRDPNAQLSRG